MRAFIVLTALLTTLILNAQEHTAPPKFEFDEETNLIIYQDVVEVEGSADNLYLRALDWINGYFPNPSRVTRTRDRDNGEITGLHQFPITYMEDEVESDVGRVMYSFTLEFKEGRYRYTITDFVLRKASRFPVENWLDKNDPNYLPRWNDYLHQVDDFSESWIESLKKGMEPKPEVKEDDW